MVTLLDCGPTWETPRLEYPYNQRFILDTFVNSNIRSYGVLHRFSSLCSAGAIGRILILARKFSHLPSADITRFALK
ncbi:MAG: hypothetical protein K2G11_06580 [Muribaculaceae bacterium]|nr:hypothetical protein [Muribaculaceae bacterium]